MALKSKYRTPAIMLVSALALTGCVTPGSNISTDNKAQKNQPKESLDSMINLYAITPELVRQQNQTPIRAQNNVLLEAELQEYDYKVGSGDILNIIVWDHPELTTPAGSYRSAEESGSWVRADGTIYYPYIGLVEVRGKSVDEVRSLIQTKLARYIEKPQVDVNVASFRSQKVYVTGEVEEPGKQAITNVPLTLLDAINQAGDISEDADWRNATINRNGKVLNVSIYALMQKGDLTHNFLLQDGDIVHVPRNDAQKVFVMGDVNSAKKVDIGRNGISLTEALSDVGGINEMSADATGIFVMRGSQQEGKLIDVYQFNMSDASALMLGTEFELQPYDVVYVTSAPVSRWNRFIGQLAPTVTMLKNLTTLSQSYIGTN